MTEIKKWKERVTLIEGKPDTYSWNDAVTQMEAEIAELRAALAQQQDDPDCDGIAGANPAWWRGHDHTSIVFCKKVNEILDGKDDGHGVGNPPWEPLRRRLLALAQGRPVAWLSVDSIGERFLCFSKPEGESQELFTKAQPAREPMTEQQAWSAWLAVCRKGGAT